MDTLGSTNSRPKNVVEKTLPLKRRGFSPLFDAATSRIFISARSIPAYTDTSAHAERLPTLYLPISKVSVLDLLPSIFSASTLERSVITRWLCDGYFWAYAPPVLGLTQLLWINREFGTLTLGWVVPLSDTELTPVPSLLPSQTLTDY